MSRSFLSVAAALGTSLAACDKTADTPVADASFVPTATAVDAAPPKPAWDAASMPPRPVPKTSPTVGSGMSPETQMQAIAYMNALQEPHPDDALVDQAFVKSLVEQLRPGAMAMDKGSTDAKTKMNRVEVIASGRRIDMLLAQGCEAETPRRAVQRAGQTLEGLLIHGVLVVKCNDARTQCLQSTRDPDDVLCTTAPRHK